MIQNNILKKDFPKGFFIGINTIYGKSATGKTTFCMQETVNLLNQNKKVVFIDTEDGFNFERAKQLRLSSDQLPNLLLFRPKSFFEQEESLVKLSKINIPDLGIIILDTIGMFYRLQAQKNFSIANDSLKRQIQILKNIANEKKVPIIIANQVYTDISNGEMKMLADTIMKRSSDVLIELKYDQERILCLKKPFENEHHFEIVNEGLVESYLKQE